VRALALVGGRPVGRLELRAVSDPGRLLHAAWRRRRWHGRVAALVVAARGVWSVAERRVLAARLRGLAPRVQVLADAQAALLGALGGRPGLLVLAGTGSIVVGRDARGRWVRAGGLGPLIGDEGSGFWLGRQWLRANLDARGEIEARRLATRPDAVARIAGLAPGVLARAVAGDPKARMVVRDGQRALAAQGVTVARRLGARGPIDATWAGTLMSSPTYRAGVLRAAARAGLRARWHPPIAEPVVAAACLAAALIRRSPSR
jgi:N-acetylglucosamine kinase-like BadF-type ATPase